MERMTGGWICRRPGRSEEAPSYTVVPGWSHIRFSPQSVSVWFLPETPNVFIGFKPLHVQGTRNTVAETPEKVASALLIENEFAYVKCTNARVWFLDAPAGSIAMLLWAWPGFVLFRRTVRRWRMT